MDKWIYIFGIMAIVVIMGFIMASRAEMFSTVIPPKFFPEVIGLPLGDALVYMSKYNDTYAIRTVSTRLDEYRRDMSSIYLVVDDANIVIDTL